MSRQSPGRPSGDVPTVNIGEIEKRVDDWVSSKEGSEQLLAARDSARAAVEKVAADAQVEPEQLRKAVTPPYGRMIKVMTGCLVVLAFAGSAQAQCYGFNCSPRGYDYQRYAPRYYPPQPLTSYRPFWMPRGPYSMRPPSFYSPWSRW